MAVKTRLSFWVYQDSGSSQVHYARLHPSLSAFVCPVASLLTNPLIGLTNWLHVNGRRCSLLPKFNRPYIGNSQASIPSGLATNVIYLPETLEVAGIRDHLEVGSQAEAESLALKQDQ